MEEEEHKTGKRESLLKKQHMVAHISKDFVRETTKKTDDDGCFMSSSESSPEQLEKDKGNQSLSTCEQQVPRSIATFSPVESKEVEVKVLRMSIVSPDRSDVVMPIPFPATTSKATLFSLKEGSKYRTIFHFTVSNNTVNGLYYTYMVWKAGIRVCNSKKMIGSFSPREEAYTFEAEEGTTPSGFFVRGPFLVRSKFVDDDARCYLDTTYHFDIRKHY